MIGKLLEPIQADTVSHWSGENSECDRQVAAAALLDRLVTIEAGGGAYHLVGHSHGGSVLWATLCLACERGVELRGLRSWTTVGTPFLSFRRRSSLFVLVTTLLVLSAVVVIPDIRGSMIAALAGANGIWANAYKSAGWFGVGFIALGLLLMLAIPVRWFWRRMTLRRRAFERLAAERYGQRWLAVNSEEDEAINALKSALVTRPFSLRWPAPKSVPPSHDNVSQVPGFVDHRAESEAAPRPDHDVAQDGIGLVMLFLVALLALPFLPDDWDRRILDEFVKRPALWGPILAAFVLVLLRFGYNRYCVPRLDVLVHNRLMDWAYGNDTKSFRVASVSTCPGVAGQGSDCPRIPAELDIELVSQANEHVAEMVPSLRRFLVYQATLRAPTLSETASLAGINPSGRELIHTSYFEHPRILDIVRAQILLNSQADATSADMADHEIADWIGAFKETAAAAISSG